MKAYEILERYGWTQGAFARRADGSVCDPDDPNAKEFDIFGAMWRAYGSWEAAELLAVKVARHIGDPFAIIILMLSNYNDRIAVKKDEVIRILKEEDI